MAAGGHRQIPRLGKGLRRRPVMVVVVVVVVSNTASGLSDMEYGYQLTLSKWGLRV